MKTNKKGFTIVELVIVIAIIAVLAAVLIPIFAGLIRTAQANSDMQLIRNLNTALRVDKPNEKHPTMQSALDAAAVAGYDVSRINKSSADGNEILWDSKNDVFCYLVDDESQPTYIPEFPEKETAKQVDYFRIANDVDVDSQYSTYLYEYQGTTTKSQPLTTSKGLDVGTESVAYIKYENSDAQEVVIRTNGGILTVNAPADTVKHYDEAAVLIIEDVDTENCYREFGTVANAQIKKGKIVIESAEAKIENLLLIAKEDKSGFEKIVVEIKAGAELPVFDRTDVNIAANGTLVLNLVTPSANEYIYLTKAGVIEQIVVTTEKVDTTTIDVTTVASAKPASQTSETTYTAAQQVANVGKKNEAGNYVDSNDDVIALENLTSENIVIENAKANETAVQTGLTQFSGGAGTEKSPFIIASKTDWETLAAGSKTPTSPFGVAGYSYKVVNDLDMSDINLNLGSGRKKIKLAFFHGTIDFDNHTWTTSYNTIQAYDLISCSYNGCTIKNANFYLSGSPSIISSYTNDHTDAQNIVLQNINIYGNIVAGNTNNYAPFCSCSNFPSEGSKLTMENCNNYCNITSSADNTGIFVGRTYGTSASGNYYYKIELINCNNYGSLINTNGNAGMLFSNANDYFDASKVTVKNCGNYGTIIGKTNANLICGNLNEKYYDKTNANYNPNNNVEGLDVSNKQIGVCGKAEISTLNVDENGNFVLPQTANAEYYVLSFVTTYNDGGGATTSIAYRLTEEQRAALDLKAYKFSVDAGSNSTTDATAITVGDGTLYVKDERYLFINQITSESDRYINRQPTVSFIAFDENGKMLAAYNYTYSN